MAVIVNKCQTDFFFSLITLGVSTFTVTFVLAISNCFRVWIYRYWDTLMRLMVLTGLTFSSISVFSHVLDIVSIVSVMFGLVLSTFFVCVYVMQRRLCATI